MDFHSLPRRQLQTLCKQYKIPANTTNVAMATALHNLLNTGSISEAVVSALLTPNKAEVTPALATPGRLTRSQMKKQLQEVPKLDIEAAEHPVLESSKKPPVSRKSTVCSSSTTEPKHREQKCLFDTSDEEVNSGISYHETGKSLSARKPRSSRVSSGVPKSAVASVVEEDTISEGQSEEISSAAENVATQEISIEEHQEDVEDVSAFTGVTKSDEVEEEAEVVVPAKDTEVAGDSAMAVDENLIEETNADIAESFESQRWKYTCIKAGGEKNIDNALEHASEESVAAKGQESSVVGLDTEVTVTEISIEDQVHDNVIADDIAAGEKETDDAAENAEDIMEYASEETSLHSVAAKGQDAFVVGQDTEVTVTEFCVGDKDVADDPQAEQVVFHYPELDQVDTEDNIRVSVTEDADGIQDEEQHIGGLVADTEVYMIEADEEEEVKAMVVNEKSDAKLQEGFVHVGSDSVDEEASRMDDDQLEEVKIGASESSQHIGADAVEQLSVALSEVKLSGKVEKQRKLELSATDKENLPFGFERLSLRQLRKVYKTRVEKKAKRVQHPKSEVTPLSPNVRKNNSAH